MSNIKIVENESGEIENEKLTSAKNESTSKSRTATKTAFKINKV